MSKDKSTLVRHRAARNPLSVVCRCLWLSLSGPRPQGRRVRGEVA